MQTNLESTQKLKKAAAVITKGDQPLSRVKSASAVTKAGKLFLFGGFDEDDNLDPKVYILDIHRSEWSIHIQNIYREGHSVVSINNDKILVYGGVPEEVSPNQLSHCEMLIYDIDAQIWLNAQSHGIHVPKTRSRHAACLSQDGTKMFISGGLFKDNLNSPYDDLYCYDIETGVWDGPRKFICRFDHFIAHYDDKIWAFGGLTNEMAHVTDIAWFDLKTNTVGYIRINDLPKLEGDHIYLNSGHPSLLLDVTVPLWTYDYRIEPCIGLYDINSLRWQAVLTGSFKPLLGYRWRHTFIHDNKLYLLGYPITPETNDSSFDYKLSSLINLELSDLGIPNSDYVNFEENSLMTDFNRLLKDSKFTDFKIIGVEGDERPSSINDQFLEHTQLDTPFSHGIHDIQGGVYFKSAPLDVHKIILLARWPHFERIIESGMVESQTNELFITEPIEWLKHLIEFIYTDKLSTRNIEILTGLLVLSNLYELPKLRQLCIEAIYRQGFKIKNVLRIWSRAKLVNEQILAHNASTFCFYNWGRVVKTRQFKELSKEELVNLCQEVEQDGMIISSMKHNDEHDVGKGYVDRLDGNNGFLLNRFDTFGLTSGFNQYSGTPVFGLQSNQVLLDGVNEGDNETNDGSERTETGTDVENDDDDDTSPSSYRSRLATPQASIFLSNPQSGMNSLGERREEEDEEDTDMEA